MGLITLPYLISEVENGTLDLWSYSLPLFDNGTAIYASLNWIGWIIGGLIIGVGAQLMGLSYNAHTMVPIGHKRSIVGFVVAVLSAFAMTTFRYYIPFLEGDATAE